MAQSRWMYMSLLPIDLVFALATYVCSPEVCQLTAFRGGKIRTTACRNNDKCDQTITIRMKNDDSNTKSTKEKHQRKTPKKQRPTFMLNAFGTCSESRSACLLIFSSLVSPPADTAFGASEICRGNTQRN